jgi:hypothetical protein
LQKGVVHICPAAACTRRVKRKYLIDGDTFFIDEAATHRVSKPWRSVSDKVLYTIYLIRRERMPW